MLPNFYGFFSLNRHENIFKFYLRSPKKSYDRNTSDAGTDNRIVRQITTMNTSEESNENDGGDNFHRTSQLFEHFNVEFESSEISPTYQFESHSLQQNPLPMAENVEHFQSPFGTDYNGHRHQSPSADSGARTIVVDESFEKQFDCQTRLILGMENPASQWIPGLQGHVHTGVSDQV